MVEANTINPSSSEIMISINVKPFCFFIVLSEKKRLTGGVAGEARFTGNCRRTSPYSSNIAKNHSCSIAAGAERNAISADSASLEIKRTVIGFRTVHINRSAEITSGYCLDCTAIDGCACAVSADV